MVEDRSRSRWANEATLFELLNEGNGDHAPNMTTLPNVRGGVASQRAEFPDLQQTPITLVPVSTANIYSRRHSAHSMKQEDTTLPPPVPLRPPPAVPKRNNIPPSNVNMGVVANVPMGVVIKSPPTINPNAPHSLINGNINCVGGKIPNITPLARNRVPPLPPARRSNPNSPNFTKKPSSTNLTDSPKTAKSAFEFNPKFVQEYGMATPPMGGPVISPHTPKSYAIGGRTKNKMSMRQDSGISSDSFSQTSSPSYTSKTMETPLLPPRTPPASKQHGGLNGLSHAHKVKLDLMGGDDEGGASQTITKSASTPASLQTIVRLQNGTNTLHHKICKDINIRRPSSNYNHHNLLKFRFAQLALNAFALLAIGGGMIVYFKAYPLEVHIVNNATVTNISTAAPIIIYEKAPPTIEENPAPGICLPVIVTFCQQYHVPYNFTIFPNFMGHFGQPEAQQELEVYDALVDVRCYELSALFLCSIFVPKCGPNGALVGPCRSLCMETKERCGFFLNVFGLELPDYLLKCSYFPESPDSDVCIGHREVKEAKSRAKRPVCVNGFQCDGKRCIPKDWKCDGHLDCLDESDEKNCTTCGAGEINCGQNKCVSNVHMCDGVVDCPWGQDERNCLRLSEQNGDEGRGQLEVFRPALGQFVPACVRHFDAAWTADQICFLLGYSNSSESHRRNNDGGALDLHETTTQWRRDQAKQSKNMIRDFVCRTKTYPTIELTCTNYMCGKVRRNYIQRNRYKRIVGGTPSKPGDWPFLAAILGGSEQIFYCAGVLIADQWVLTASHCVGNHSDVGGWTIQLGITRRHAHSYYGQKIQVKRVVPHPKYNLGIAHDNDVALFQLSSRVTFHEHLSPVCLPSAEKELHPGTVCTVIGWGKKEDSGRSEYSPEINEVDVPILNRELCNKWLENRELNVTDGMICAGYQEGGKDACQGDSGGPLLCRDESDRERWFVGGIVSWGIKCAHPHLPGVYAYVPKYIPWILEQMQEYAD